MRVSIIIQSLLSDAMIEMDSNPILAQKRLRFVKYLVHMFPDTTIIIDEDIVYEQFRISTQY
jgi:hypothetical protein